MQLAREDEARACREFNQMMGLQGEDVKDTLEKISDKVNAFSDVGKLVCSGKRADVLAAESSYKSSEYADRETKYRAMPELSLNGTYALNGIGFEYADAWEQLTSQAKPTFTVGLSFIIPLDYKTLSKVKKGYNNEFASSKQTFASALTAAQNDWDELQKNWADVKSRLALVKEIMNIQSERVKNEQMKYEKGRTTTFLYLSAQNDLDDAVLNLYRTVLEEIMTFAKAELFNTQPIVNK
jgi:outer membrane protein TolC